MEVHVTAGQEGLIRHAIEAGRVRSEKDAVMEAIELWEKRELRRLEILAAVDEAEVSLAQGLGRTISSREELKQLVEDIKRRGMARLSAEQRTG